MNIPRASFNIQKDKTAWLVIDMQRGFLRAGNPIDGKAGADIYTEMIVAEHDIIITKNHCSAFAGTNLQSLLEISGIDTEIIAGVDVHVCCEATARDARHQNLHVIFPTDGTATRDQPDADWGIITTDEMQRNVLTRMSLGYADDASIEEVITPMEGN